MNPESLETAPKKTDLIKKKQLIIGASIAGVILIIVVVIIVILLNQQRGPSGTSIQQVQRDGYENVAKSIGDPAPINEEMNANVVTFGEMPVAPACSLLALDDLKKIGVLLSPKTVAGGFTRTYFDGQGSKTIDTHNDLSLPNQGNNTCTYQFEPSSNLQLTVYQPSYTNALALQRDISRRYSAQTAINDVKVFSRNADSSAKNTQTFDYYLQKDTTTARLTLSLQKNAETETTKQRLLEATVAGFYKPPSGPSNIVYKSPIFTKSFLNACSLGDSKDFNQLFNDEAAPYLTESFNTAIGLVNFASSTAKDGNDYALIEHTCSRDSAKTIENSKKTLTITTRSYTSDTAAKHDIAHNKQTDDGQATQTTIANDSYLVTKEQTHAKGTIIFRKGRFVVEVRLEDSENPSRAVNPVSRAQTLLPIAQEVASKVLE